MAQPVLAKLWDAAPASFGSAMKALGRAHQKRTAVKDVATIQPDYKYPAFGKPVPAPALIVAVALPRNPRTRRHRRDNSQSCST